LRTGNVTWKPNPFFFFKFRLKVALKESNLSKQRGGYIIVVSPEKSEKER
jgi:hypothetical protein